MFKQTSIFRSGFNKMFKIYSSINIPEKIVEPLVKIHERYKINLIMNENDSINRNELLTQVKDCHGIICTPLQKIDKELLDAAGKHLKIISTFSVGYDHIDLNECFLRNIKICYCPYGDSGAIAEFTIGLMLNISRRIIESIKAYNTNKAIDSLYWFNGVALQGSTVGIFGLGNIGSSIAKRLKSFEPNKIIYNSRSKNADGEKQGFEYVSFEELLSQSDFLICTCSLNKDTELIFNRNTFNKMKSNAIFINVSRGMVVNQDDLYDALKENVILGAGLDVTTPLFLPADHKLLSLNNCFITPYIAWSETKTTDKRLSLAVNNIIRYMEDIPLLNEITNSK